MIPGEIILGDEPVTINDTQPVRRLTVTNTGDRPVQVGSHYHFAEANPALEFHRSAAWGHRLGIPAGTASRRPHAADRSKDSAGFDSAKW